MKFKPADKWLEWRCTYCAAYKIGWETDGSSCGSCPYCKNTYNASPGYRAIKVDWRPLPIRMLVFCWILTKVAVAIPLWIATTLTGTPKEWTRLVTEIKPKPSLPEAGQLTLSEDKHE